MSNYYHTTASAFKVGNRVEIHPTHDQWMRGNRYGEVVRVGSSVVFVKLDKDTPSRAPRWFHPESLSFID